MSHRTILGVTGLVVLATITPADDIPPPRPISAAGLVALLRSDSTADRDAAVKRLSALEVVPPELSQALRSPESEVRKLAGVAVEEIRSRPHARLLRAKTFASQGDVSLFVAATAQWDLPAGDPRVWDVPFKLATDVTKLPVGGKQVPSGVPPWRDRTYFERLAPEVVLTSGRYEPKPQLFARQRTTDYPQVVITDEYETAGAMMTSVIVARHKATTPGGVKHSGLFSNAGQIRTTTIQFSVVVCDGDVQADFVIDAVVIARGNIRVTRGADTCLLVACGEVICDDREAANPRNRVTLLPREPNPLGFVKFFELSRMGLEVSDAEKTVRVKAVADGKAFAAAGARVGDVVEGVNGKKPDSSESLRRLLRDALAVGDAAVTVRRGDATYTLKVSLPE